MGFKLCESFAVDFSTNLMKMKTFYSSLSKINSCFAINTEFT